MTRMDYQGCHPTILLEVPGSLRVLIQSRRPLSFLPLHHRMGYKNIGSEHQHADYQTNQKRRTRTRNKSNYIQLQYIQRTGSGISTVLEVGILTHAHIATFLSHPTTTCASPTATRPPHDAARLLFQCRHTLRFSGSSFQNQKIQRIARLLLRSKQGALGALQVRQPRGKCTWASRACTLKNTTS